MNFTGVVLDQHDDAELSVLKGVFQGKDLPPLVKNASLLDENTLNAIPNESFALCAVDEGSLLRKYAMTSPSVTALSTIYFLETKDLLPESAQKVAAANLVEGCTFHGIEPPAILLKMAAGTEVQTLVDISGQQPPLRVPAPGEGAVLDTPEKTAAACDWFDENVRLMHPQERHLTAVLLVKQASAQGIEVSEILGRYGSETYGPSLKLAYISRTEHLDQDDEAGHALLNFVIEKAASVSPEHFAEGLAEFDRGMGLDQYWDKGIPDPWFATFGQIKVAEYVFVDGNDRVTETALKRLAQNPILMRESFSTELVDGFTKAPVTIFDSLPLTQKKIIMRIASDTNTGGVNARTA